MHELKAGFSARLKLFVAEPFSEHTWAVAASVYVVAVSRLTHHDQTQDAVRFACFDRRLLAAAAVLGVAGVATPPP